MNRKRRNRPIDTGGSLDVASNKLLGFLLGRGLGGMEESCVVNMGFVVDVRHIDPVLGPLRLLHHPAHQGHVVAWQNCVLVLVLVDCCLQLLPLFRLRTDWLTQPRRWVLVFQRFAWRRLQPCNRFWYWVYASSLTQLKPIHDFNVLGFALSFCVLQEFGVLFWVLSIAEIGENLIKLVGT